MAAAQTSAPFAAFMRSLRSITESERVKVCYERWIVIQEELIGDR